MPIRKYIAGSAFGPEAIRIMVAAFDEACMILNVHGPDDPMSDIIAKKIVSVASQGEPDASEIARRVIADHNEQAAAAHKA
jgi:hypothetical protein